LKRKKLQADVSAGMTGKGTKKKKGKADREEEKSDSRK
jgi:hypothetical protein